MYDEMKNTQIPANKQSLNNIEASRNVDCGCYHCLSVFNGSEIKESIDGGKTALCPECGIDAVLPDITKKEILQKLNDRWF